MDDANRIGKHMMQADLALVPAAVTHLFFSLSAYKCDDLSLFPHPSVRVFNGHYPEHQLTEYSIESAGHAQAVIMCSLSKPFGAWTLETFGTTCSGNVLRPDTYVPIISAARKHISTQTGT